MYLMLEKMSMFPCRCRKCNRRKSFRRHPDKYIRPLICQCGHSSWRVDKWRMYKIPRPCNGGLCLLFFPHRRGSKGCEHYVDMLIDRIYVNIDNTIGLTYSNEPPGF